MNHITSQLWQSILAVIFAALRVVQPGAQAAENEFSGKGLFGGTGVFAGSGTRPGSVSIGRSVKFVLNNTVWTKKSMHALPVVGACFF